MSVEILNVKQGSPEWHELREGKATGSNAAALLTKGLDEAIAKNYKKFGGNFHTRRGHILEEEAIELYEKAFDVDVARPGAVINTLYPNALCSPDGIDGSILLEVKAFNHDKHLKIIREYKETWQTPFDVHAQVQFNMLISELKRGRILLYNPEVEDDSLAFFVIEVKSQKDIRENIANILNGKKND